MVAIWNTNFLKVIHDTYNTMKYIFSKYPIFQEVSIIDVTRKKTDNHQTRADHLR